MWNIENNRGYSIIHSFFGTDSSNIFSQKKSKKQFGVLQFRLITIDILPVFLGPEWSPSFNFPPPHPTSLYRIPPKWSSPFYIIHVRIVIFHAVIWYLISTRMIIDRQVSMILWYTLNPCVIFTYHFDSKVGHMTLCGYAPPPPKR